MLRNGMERKDTSTVEEKLDYSIVARYYRIMIKSFKCKKTEKVYNRKPVKTFPEDILVRARRKLLMIDASSSLKDLEIPPANRLEKLVGDREGVYSIRINNQWRICFYFENGDAFDVEIVDYH